MVFFLLKKLLFKPVLGIIEARENDIRENLAQGERAKREGLTLKSEYEEKLNYAKILFFFKINDLIKIYKKIL